jgi:four helix bundle protein
MNESPKILQRTFNFSLSIILLYKKLTSEKEFILSKQLLRSATSIGANVEEANAAQSKRDFLSKMSIASKEARETRYWLRLLKESNLYKICFDEHLAEINNIINIITRIVKTTKESLERGS